MESNEINQLTDHLFRHEAGKMVSVLTKIFGTNNLQTAEDVVQQTFMDAMRVWKFKGIPQNPSAWLFKAAKNKTIDIIRRDKYATTYDFSDNDRVLLNSEYTMALTLENLWKEESIADDMLRMMFACCHPGISPEKQITLVLKTLCGFSTAEIAKAFVTTEDNVSKRLYRAKEFFREKNISLAIPSSGDLHNRTNAVLNSIYLLFNEGYNSTHSDKLIREDLMQEAMLLCKLLTENVHTQIPETFALMALMCFHFARVPGRLSTKGEIVLLPNQDRSCWNGELIQKGIDYMNKGAFGPAISAYHIEAAIAYEHCVAPDFEATNWVRILELYDWLLAHNPSEMAAVNRAVVVKKLYGSRTALEALLSIQTNKINDYYLLDCLLGEIYAELDDLPAAHQHFIRAQEKTKSEAEKNLLREKMEALYRS